MTFLLPYFWHIDKTCSWSLVGIMLLLLLSQGFNWYIKIFFSYGAPEWHAVSYDRSLS